ncbi:sulfite exporter TauE/SafE family protein [Corynebacterium ulceribovis]|uniref:sulfite exporter TauE/SafE family protein n=1 Tax=Corynebacterium ulceribovis TaxID=487732 RepID=UPI00036FCC37|nr:sulfite exporter TauE/SafE family protein [Corynebacterium ulceribovis]
MTTAIAVLAGAVVGVIMGALGGGGAIITIPVLVYILGFAPHEAITASLIIVGISSLTALLPHARIDNVRFRQGLIFGLVGIGGSFLGSFFGARLSPDLLFALFAGLLLVVAATMFRKALRKPAATKHGTPTSISPHVLLLLLAGTGVGFLTGFFGVGGGFAIVPALMLVLGFSAPVAVGTSLLVIAVNSAVSFGFHAAGGVSVDWSVVLPYLVAAMVASLVGGRASQRLPAKVLTLSFATLLVLVALYTVVDLVVA